MLKVWLSGASALALFAGIACYLVPLQPNILALQLAFSPRALAAVIHAWSAEDLLRYRAHLPYACLLLASMLAVSPAPTFVAACALRRMIFPTPLQRV